MRSEPSQMQEKSDTFTAEEVANITAIAVMGVTGSGKSNFIKHATNSERVQVGHGMQSCKYFFPISPGKNTTSPRRFSDLMAFIGTEEIQQYQFELDGGPVLLFDTPGFDDTYRLDADILAELAETFSALYKSKLKLAGIIYVHRITDNRMTNTLLRNLSVIRNLCGEDPLKNVTLLTTFWDKEDFKTAKKREEEMVETQAWWGYMVSKGSKVRRFQNTTESAHDILREFMDKERVTLKIQEEMVDQGLKVKDTQAGAALNVEIAQLAEQHQQELVALEEKMKKALRDRDAEMQEVLAMERREKEKELVRMQREQTALERDRSEDMRRMEQAFQDQLLRMVEERKERDAQILKLEQQLTLERADSDRRVQKALDDSEAALRRIEEQMNQARVEDHHRHEEELQRYRSERDHAIQEHKEQLEAINAEIVRIYQEKQSAGAAEKYRLELEIQELKNQKRKSKAALWAKIGGGALCAILAPFTGGLSTLFMPALTSLGS